MDTLITTFNIDWKVVLAQVVNFGIIFAVVYYAGLRPLGKLMDERSKKIEAGLASAKAGVELKQQARSEFDDALRGARKEAAVLVTEATKNAEEKRQEILTSAKKDAEAIVAKAQGEIEKFRLDAELKLKEHLADMVISSTKKVLGENPELTRLTKESVRIPSLYEPNLNLV